MLLWMIGYQPEMENSSISAQRMKMSFGEHYLKRHMQSKSIRKFVKKLS